MTINKGKLCEEIADNALQKIRSGLDSAGYRGEIRLEVWLNDFCYVSVIYLPGEKKTKEDC